MHRTHTHTHTETFTHGGTETDRKRTVGPVCPNELKIQNKNNEERKLLFKIK